MIRKIRYLIEAIIAYSAFSFFSVLPYKTASGIGGFIARTIGPKMRVSKVAFRNIEKAMPKLTKEEIDKIVVDMWDNLGRVCGEFPHIGKMDEKKFKETVKVTGLENLLNNKDKVGIFASGHFANWELLPKTAMLNGFPLDIVYRTANNPFVEKLINKNRAGYQNKAIKKGAAGAREIIKSINNKAWIGMLVDQKQNDGIEVPFFGIGAMTASAIANLSLKYDCNIFTISIKRVNKTQFEINIDKPIEIEKTDSVDDDIYNIMLKINKRLESTIRQAPSQWLWMHRRWPHSKRKKKALNKKIFNIKKSA